MRVVETFYVDRSPNVVFEYVTNPANLGDWQTANRSVEQLSDGAPGLGSRFRERTKPPGMREFEQITEFVEFDRPTRLHVHVVEGPHLIDGTWSFEPSANGTRVSFVAEGDLRGPMRLLEPLVKRIMARNFAGYHRNLRRNVEAD